jgi:hypothetical protein
MAMWRMFETESMLVASGAIAFSVLAGCVCPPCPEAGGATTPVAAAGQTGAVAPGGKLIVWDGDENGMTAKGWQNCEKKQKPDCVATLEPASEGRNHTKGLKFHGDGPGWVGFGWHLFGWYPADASYDVSGYKSFVVWMKVDAKSPDLAPELGALTIGLTCLGDKCEGKVWELKKYVKGNLVDGQWHELVLPMADAKKPGFDPGKVVQVVFGSWAGVSKDFSVYLDDMAFENR